MKTETKVNLCFFTLGMVANALFSDQIESAKGLAAYRNHPTVKDQFKHSKEIQIAMDEYSKKFLQDNVTKTSDADHQDSDDFVY